MQTSLRSVCVIQIRAGSLVASLLAHGRDGIRTRDVLVRNQELYPLSYAPTIVGNADTDLVVVKVARAGQGVSPVSSEKSAVG